MNLKDIPIRAQRHDGVTEQMCDLMAIANRMGMYDAADTINQLFEVGYIIEPIYGCHCDLEPGQEPDGCVIDEGRPQDCVYAGRGIRKEQCEYWKIK